MGSKNKRQQTMAKLAREQALKDRRARKQEKKQAAAARRAEAAARPAPDTVANPGAEAAG
jgi:hypothetical protein